MSRPDLWAFHGRPIGDWNVVASTREHGFQRARKVLAEFGEVGTTGYHNVLVLRVDDPTIFAERLRAVMEEDPGVRETIARAEPCTICFHFSSPADFEAKAREAILAFVPALMGRAFHVRLHRRGFKGKLSSAEEERFADDVLLDALAAAGAPGRITFDDPDVIVAIETVDNRAGLALWTRADLARFPFLKVD
jgi:tRNA(Ser,Leu) C12 N-acetylase TAN1